MLGGPAIKAATMSAQLVARDLTSRVTSPVRSVMFSACGPRQRAVERRTEITVVVVEDAAGVGADVVGAAPTQRPVDGAEVVFPRQPASGEIVRRYQAGDDKIRNRCRARVTDKIRTDDEH